MSRSKRRATAREQTSQNLNALAREIMILHKLFEEHLVKGHGFSLDDVKKFYSESLNPPQTNVAPQTEPKKIEELEGRVV